MGKKRRINRLAFDSGKHDAAVDGGQERQARETAGGIIDKISRVWCQKALALRSKRKCTPADLKAFLDEMEVLVDKWCVGNHAGPFREMALHLIREKAELLRLTEWDQANVLTPMQDQPIVSGLPKAIQPVTVRYSFKTLVALEKLPPVAQAKAAPGYVGLVLDTNQLLAVFDEGGFRLLGMVTNGIGLERVPSRQQYVAALNEGK